MNLVRRLAIDLAEVLIIALASYGVLLYVLGEMPVP